MWATKWTSIYINKSSDDKKLDKVTIKTEYRDVQENRESLLSRIADSAAYAKQQAGSSPDHQGDIVLQGPGWYSILKVKKIEDTSQVVNHSYHLYQVVEVTVTEA